MYKIIDEKLGLASCSISDLTMKQVHDFLSKWEEGASIGTLTLFYDEERNMIVLNQDNKNYEFYLDITQKYMGLSEKRQEEVAQKAPESLQETIKVLQQSIKVMKYQKELDIVRHNTLPRDYVGNIQYIWSKDLGLMTATDIFVYGMICGKRAERARKKGQQNEKAD